MRFLLAGGSGAVGKDITASLLKMGHRVRILDINTDAVQNSHHENLEVIKGSIGDSSLVKEVVRDIDVVVHLAWSFAQDPAVLIESDLKGHIALLEAAAAAKVSHFFYTSSAIVYGKPVSMPVTEKDPCLVEEARRPFYSIAKLTAEKLVLAYWKTKGLPVTVFRFWWSYGEEIGGRHLRDLAELAVKGEQIMVPEDSGGSFLHHSDLTNALLLAAQKKNTCGEIFNLATLYLSWEDIARAIIDSAGSASPLVVVPAEAWTGAQFLADPWRLCTCKAEHFFKYKTLLSSDAARQGLKDAIVRLVQGRT